MVNLERTIDAYFTSTRHSASIGGANKAVHDRRSALLARGKVNQAVAIKRARRASGADGSRWKNQPT